MSQDMPAEFLPPLPGQRNRASVGVRDARVEAMMAAMEQRPSSIRRPSVDSTRSRGASVDATIQQAVVAYPIAISPERPMSMRSNASEQQRPRLELYPPLETRPIPSQSTDRPRGDSAAYSDDGRKSVSSNFSRGGSRAADLPVAMAEVESPADKAPPPFARSFSNTPGNRNTLTLSDEELARRLHEQLNMMPAEDGQIVTAEIVQQEVMDRRQAEQALDDEIAALESAVMARQLDSARDVNDAGQADDDAFRAAWANNDNLDYMRPVSHKPIFSAIIFLTCVIAMCAEIGINGGIEPFQANPTIGPKPEVLLQMGAKRADLILEGQWWRLIAPIILHAGILHLLFNMLGLWNIGVPMEREFGSLRISSIFITAGLAGVLCSCLFAPRLTSVGASGAIFGLFGAAWADLIQNWSLYKGSQIRMLIQLILVTVFNVVLGLMPFLDNYAHLGGLITGCILGLVILVQTRYYYSGVQKRKRTYQIVLMVVSTMLLPGLLIAGYVVFFLRVPINCPACSYISCVPMPPGADYAQRWWSCDECSQGGLSGDIEPTNNTLIFNCPNTGVRQTKTFPPTTSIDTGILVQTCIERCLS